MKNKIVTILLVFFSLSLITYAGAPYNSSLNGYVIYYNNGGDEKEILEKLNSNKVSSIIGKVDNYIHHKSNIKNNKNYLSAIDRLLKKYKDEDEEKIFALYYLKSQIDNKDIKINNLYFYDKDLKKIIINNENINMLSTLSIRTNSQLYYEFDLNSSIKIDTSDNRNSLSIKNSRTNNTTKIESNYSIKYINDGGILLEDKVTGMKSLYLIKEDKIYSHGMFEKRENSHAINFIKVTDKNIIAQEYFDPYYYENTDDASKYSKLIQESDQNIFKEITFDRENLKILSIK